MKMFGIERVVETLSDLLKYELFFASIQIVLFIFLFRLRARRLPDPEDDLELKQRNISHLRIWLSEQSHLPHVTDEELLLFLHACKYDLESTKNRIDSYFTVRTMAPEIFSKRVPSSPEIRKVLETVAMGRLADKSVHGYDVFISTLCVADPDESCDLADILKVYTMHADLCWRERTSPGVLYIVDIRRLTLAHALVNVNLTVVTHIVNYLQEGLPIRLQGIHLLNCPPLIDMIVDTVKPFVKQELFNLLHYHQANAEQLHDYIPKSILPQDYGGNGENMEKLAAGTFKLLLENEQWFAEEERRVDDTKLRERLRFDVGGFPANRHFRNLDFD